MQLTIREIEMRNFLTHRQEHVTFPDGIVLLWGPSGAGKTSLLEAASFAVYGLAGTRAASIADLRHESYPDEDFGVRATFNVGPGRTVQIFRGVERDKTVVWMVDPEGNLTEGPKAVAAQVAELMGGMDAQTFFSTYFSQQGELDALVKMPGGGRRKFVQRMLGITMLDKVTTRINKELLRATERIAFLDETLPDTPKDQLSANAQALDEQIKTITEHGQALKTEVDTIKLSAEKLAAAVAAADDTAATANTLGPRIQTAADVTIPQLRAAVTAAEAAVKDAQDAQQRLSDSDGERQRLRDLQQQAERLADADTALRDLTVIEADLSAAQDALTAAEQRRASLSDLPSVPDVSSQRREAQELHGRLGSLEHQVTQLAADQQALTGSGECFTCHRPIDDPEQLLADLAIRAETAERDLAAARQRLAELQAEITEAEAVVLQRDALQHDHQQAASDLKHAETTASNLKARMQAAKQRAKAADADTLTAVREDLNRSAEAIAALDADERLAAALADRQQQLDDHRQQLAQADQQLAADREQLTALAYDAEAHRQLRQRAADAQQRYLTLHEQLGELREQARQMMAARKEITGQLSRYDSILADRGEAEARHGKLKRLETLMKAFKAHMIGQIRPTLEARTSEILSQITDGALPAVQIDEDYNVSVKTSRGWRRIGMCSGGEQARAAFALRLALTQLVAARTDTPVGFMTFDEIFGSQDEAHRRELLSALRGLRSMPQIFLISHQETIAESEMVDQVVDIPNADSINRIRVRGR